MAAFRTQFQVSYCFLEKSNETQYTSWPIQPRTSAGGPWLPPWILKILWKKVGFEWVKPNFATCPPLEKFWKNPLLATPGKNPSEAHGYNTSRKNCRVRYSCADSRRYRTVLSYILVQSWYSKF